MLHTGMLSVTFRNLQPEEIIRLTVQAGLDAIEWGGDIHVPHGNVEVAKRVKRLTEEAGLIIASYGSYYKAGVYDSDVPYFEDVLSSAIALGAPAIRIWAGNKGSEKVELGWRDQVIADIIRVANQAQQENIRIHLEYHANTLTDTLESTLALLEAVGHPNVGTNWQPPTLLTFGEQLESLDGVLPFLADVHVYYLQLGERYPLSSGSEEWGEFFHRISSSAGNSRFALLEFVRGNDPKQFLEDAGELRRLLKS
ncbi:sugar phosphate isomerase/epimerase family protein [Paenibacillus nasutitermitis]|uniref:Sugar phosphate isomerase n=1 Tax=Paenibacillus nasutitermitis TaxID=1652958 RepID=A0A916ZAB1_9BACL|nr:TIM barrel protein [Paenibacillus nasutitermitis]GGD83433.1 sugar phosphate isomerase [Paenibacillus nasutitermitis]